MRVLLRFTTDPPDSGNSDRPIDFHRHLPGYRESPLVEAPRLAERLGVVKVYVKDETLRFGLPSFKGWVSNTTAGAEAKPHTNNSPPLS